MRVPLVVIAALAAVVAFPLRAPAAVSVAGGVFTENKPSGTGGAVLISSGGSIPSVPLEFQGTYLAPLVNNGGYALTGEIRGFTGGGYGGAYVGAGAGIGDLSSDGSSGTVLTVFAGKSIAPLTSIEIRLYKQIRDTGATAGFVGLRFSF